MSFESLNSQHWTMNFSLMFLHVIGKMACPLSDAMLPVSYRCQFKILLIVFKCIHKLAPTYLCKRLTLKPKRGLRSDNKLVLDIPLTELKLKTYGDRSFSIAGPTLWNKLPSDIRLSESLDIFKQKLKTHFFKQAFY